MYFDFFSLDVEGGELAVLKGIDFEKLGFGVIVVECHGTMPAQDFAICDLLNKAGYIIFGRDKMNCWFRNSQFEIIYGFPFAAQTFGNISSCNDLSYPLGYHQLKGTIEYRWSQKFTSESGNKLVI